jgi:hypothetical protein
LQLTGGWPVAWQIRDSICSTCPASAFGRLAVTRNLAALPRPERQAASLARRPGASDMASE